jgi:hypothetical protein
LVDVSAELFDQTFHGSRFTIQGCVEHGYEPIFADLVDIYSEL